MSLIAALAGIGIGYGVSPNAAPTPQQMTIESVAAADFVATRPQVSALPQEEISADERAGLLFMREEEKLARDVYQTLYEKWQMPIFSNIAQSEQTHTEAVQTLLTKYRIPDPVVDDTIGVFVDPTLDKLYTELSRKGLESREAALAVGATIEDLDLRDLERALAANNNEDIALVYENLARASRNHLRAFVRQIDASGGDYVPQYISQDAYDAIIAGSQETGSGGERRGWGQGRRQGQ